MWSWSRSNLQAESIVLLRRCTVRRCGRPFPGACDIIYRLCLLGCHAGLADLPSSVCFAVVASWKTCIWVQHALSKLCSTRNQHRSHWTVPGMVSSKYTFRMPWSAKWTGLAHRTVAPACPMTIRRQIVVFLPHIEKGWKAPCTQSDLIVLIWWKFGDYNLP
jgi:hypothetical protein